MYMVLEQLKLLTRPPLRCTQRQDGTAGTDCWTAWESAVILTGSRRRAAGQRRCVESAGVAEAGAPTGAQ